MGFFSRLFSKKKEKPTVAKRDPLSIKVGDIIEYDLSDYEVVGKIVYRQGNYEWISYQLLGESDTLWLAVEMDDELELGIYKRIQLPEASSYPKRFEYEGITYYLDESGQANIRGEGRSSNLTGQVMKYTEYCDDSEEHFISLEDWGSEVEASYGYPIQSFEIKIIAGTN
ncbi:protein of unknown function [Gracilibacillus ureilyticus]|uniref:DUF4178 domain-containing protein n=1 Tax=Gracilibacillus ureilyticus TaxID=531814 RepID=A0A1H9UCN9_9BACI|nr:DUF4178 domain-containing protein [Gracilibacillus ureilyticus]SES07330.1 protein of unknown function [Gracilibacillus ureilyticus]